MKRKNNNRNMTVNTPYGTLTLARNKTKQFKKTVMQLQRTTDALTRKDIGDWRNAWQLAINVDNPNRQRLYDIYRDVEVDLHLSGCISQREGFVMARSFKLVNEKGEEMEEVANYFNTKWFKDIIKMTLEANYWGHSLIELGNITTDINGNLTFDGVSLVPRKHVIPEYHRVVPDLGQDWHTGIDYHEKPYSQWIIEVGQPDSLGLYLKAATQTIPKKNALAFWDTFAEIFGMPMRIARTTTRDEKERRQIEQMLEKSGNAGYMLADQGTELEFVESSKGDAYNVYDRRTDRANSELSKLIIGQTMTIEDGSSLSQSKTHLEVFQNIIEADCDKIRDMVNNQLIPIMILHGFPLKGIHFEWDYSVDYTPEQQVAYETMVLNNYEVDGSYFEEKYNIPAGERRQMLTPVAPTEQPQDDEDTKGNKTPKPDKKTQQEQNNARPFFD